MSDVRLSNASPVERVDARQQDSVRPSVRRNLFGRADPEEIRRDAETSVREDVQRFREQYDFDLVEHRPLTPRSYAWVTDDDAPEFYLRQPHGRLSPQPRSDSLEDNRQINGSDERPSGRQPGRNGSRKKRAEAADSCSTECPTKRSRSSDGDDDDDDNSAGAGSQTITAAAERPGRAEGGAELQ